MRSHVEHECQGKIDDNGRSKGKEGGVNEKQAYGGSGYTKLVAQIRANPKSVSFKKKLNSLH